MNSSKTSFVLAIILAVTSHAPHVLAMQKIATIIETGKSRTIFASVFDTSNKTIVILLKERDQLELLPELAPIQDEITGHKAQITHLNYSKYHKILASADTSGIIKLWVMNKRLHRFVLAQTLQTKISATKKLYWHEPEAVFVIIDDWADTKTLFALNPITNKFAKLHPAKKNEICADLHENLDLTDLLDTLFSLMF